MERMTFVDFFKHMTEFPPYPWQEGLAKSQTCESGIIRVPTGLGKTQGVMLAWLWNAVWEKKDGWPRRLIWCLPMRVLVEQTHRVAEGIVKNLENIKKQHPNPDVALPEVHLLMGGEEPKRWDLYPERPAIIVGTQDMLLSRALNHGYALSRARWPMEFGLMHTDSLWVFDETQLMDVGLATSGQLQAYRQRDADKPDADTPFYPCRTWWMSATLQAAWLKTVDTEKFHQGWSENAIELDEQQRKSNPLCEIRKELETVSIGAKEKHDKNRMIKKIVYEHNNHEDTGFGAITLVVCNTVDRAVEVYGGIKKHLKKNNDESGVELKLVHSRFRPYEREKWKAFLDRKACSEGANRIIVATQVVEAGVDISAGLLITELAPWSSLVQRFGRCARYGGKGRVVVVNRELKEKDALPYESAQLDVAWCALETIESVGIADLEGFEQNFEQKQFPQSLLELYPYTPKHLLTQQEFYELFDTTPDLTGGDVDVGRFIRSGEERDVYVFWRDIDKKDEPDETVKPQRNELCAVSIGKLKKWLKGHSEKAWTWDWVDGEWTRYSASSVRPGHIVCARGDVGGYSSELGFDGKSKKAVEQVPLNEERAQKPQDLPAGDDSHDSDSLSRTAVWKTIATHMEEVDKEVNTILEQTPLPSRFRLILSLAAKTHDIGKAHPAFQGKIKENAAGNPKRRDIAKAPDEAWEHNKKDSPQKRAGFRHELASALALFSWLKAMAPDHNALLGPWRDYFEAMEDPLAEPNAPTEPDGAVARALYRLSAEDFDLLAYLVVAHHGKVRMAFNPAPGDQRYEGREGQGQPIRGVCDKDVMPSIQLDKEGEKTPELTLSLEPAKMGLSTLTGASWRERTERLLERYGPCALAYLEATLRAADCRASALTTPDPLLNGKP